ncbi:hypothetical protein JW823_05890 [bacterium]|nr:hypothetical protein [candidate division CSSED10-310 bacterium]
MKRLTRWMAIGISIAAITGVSVSADSFGMYFGSDGWGFNMNFGDYDYYNRYSPGYYDNSRFDFEMALSPYGAWQYIPELGGNVWIPDVPNGWRPYSYGSWSYTSYGWTWTAYEPWGWIPHHYGNWIFHPAFHWIWIPGYTWAPAHVTWGFFNGYYGWAPLPPRHSAYYSSYRHDRRYHHYDRSHHWYSRHNNPNHGYSYNGSAGSSDDEYYEWIPNDAWVIVSSNQFMNDNISDIAMNPNQNAGMFQNRSFKLNQSAPEKVMIERETRRSIPLTQVDEVTKQVNGKAVKVVTPHKIEPARVKKLSTINQNFRPVKNRNTEQKIQAPSGKPMSATGSKQTGPLTEPNRSMTNKPSSNNRPSTLQQPGNKSVKPMSQPAGKTITRPAPVSSGKQVQPKNTSKQSSGAKTVRPDNTKSVQPNQQNGKVKQPKPAGKGVRPAPTAKPSSEKDSSDNEGDVIKQK